MSTWQRRILCLHLPYLETDRVRRHQPTTDSAPLVLTRRVGNSVLIEQVCPRAAAAGLSPGETLGQAQARVPDLAVHDYDPPGNHAALQKLARWLQRFSPLVQVAPPRTILLDITGCGALFAGEDNLCRQLLGALTRRGLRVQAAVTDTVGAAWALARQPDVTLTLVPPGQASAHLAGLPPEGLRLSPTVVDQLDALGVRTLGDLFLLPRASVAARFGAETIQRLQQALGEVIEPVRDDTEGAEPHAQLALEEPIQDARVLQQLVEHLLLDLFEQLQQREQAVSHLVAVLSCANTDPLLLEIRLARPVRSLEHVSGLLRERLERVDLLSLGAGAGPDEHGCTIPNGVCGVRLQVLQSNRWQPRQSQMFDQQDLIQEEALSVLIDQVVSRLGSGSIHRGYLLDDHQPERSFRYQPAETDAQESPPPQASPLAECPSQILPQPRPIRVLGKPPRWFACGVEEHHLRQAWGPQRVETAWWRGPDVRRDYYRVESEEGEQYWLFQSLVEGDWYLHGLYV